MSSSVERTLTDSAVGPLPGSLFTDGVMPVRCQPVTDDIAPANARPSLVSPPPSPRFAMTLSRGTATRVGHESQSTVGCPVVPIGDGAVQQVASDALADRRLRYADIGWQIVRPARGDRADKLPSAAILDVYVGLLFLFHARGRPEDGRVRFSRYEFLQLIGWRSQVDGSRRKPSGRHYTQLAQALAYLHDTTFVNAGRDPQVGPDGVMFTGTQSFPMLQYLRIASAARPAGDERPDPEQCQVRFSDAFRALLVHDETTTRIDFDLFLSLSPGTPRALCRLFAWMWARGRVTISIAEAFQRLGSTQKACVPARARQILTAAHAEMRTHGILTADPVYEKVDGVWTIRYPFGDPSTALSSQALLEWQATAYGVTADAAHRYAVADERQLRRVLAAVTLGILDPKKSLAGLIVACTRNGAEISDTARRLSAQCELAIPANHGAHYLAWSLAERTRRCAERPEVDVRALRARADEQIAAADPGAAPWVADGIVAIQLNRLFDMPTMAEWARGADRDVVATRLGERVAVPPG
jgi:hypothetical protein